MPRIRAKSAERLRLRTQSPLRRRPSRLIVRIGRSNCQDRDDRHYPLAGILAYLLLPARGRTLVRRLWVVTVSSRDGFRFQPEVYRARQGAEFELGRWVRALESPRDRGVDTPTGETSARIKVGSVSVSIDPILTEDIEPNAELWVSAVFASDGSIASGPTMHHHIGQVRGWIDQQGEEDARRRISEPPGQDIRSQFTR